MSPTSRGLGRSTAIFAFWTAISRVAGLARNPRRRDLRHPGLDQRLAGAFQVPNLLRSLVAELGRVGGVVPVFTELQEQGRHKEAQRPWAA